MRAGPGKPIGRRFIVTELQRFVEDANKANRLLAEHTPREPGGDWRRGHGRRKKGRMAPAKTAKLREAQGGRMGRRRRRGGRAGPTRQPAPPAPRASEAAPRTPPPPPSLSPSQGLSKGRRRARTGQSWPGGASSLGVRRVKGAPSPSPASSHSHDRANPRQQCGRQPDARRQAA